MNRRDILKSTALLPAIYLPKAVANSQFEYIWTLKFWKPYETWNHSKVIASCCEIGKEQTMLNMVIDPAYDNQTEAQYLTYLNERIEDGLELLKSTNNPRDDDKIYESFFDLFSNDKMKMWYAPAGTRRPRYV